MAESSSDLCSVISRGGEDRDLDYKEATLWNEKDRKASCEIVKDILAMANTEGGYIVIGASERSGTPAFTGINDEQLKSWDTTRVNRFVQTYVDPPINVRLRKPVCNGKTFVVLIVPRFTKQPYLCKKEFPGVLARGTLYVRTANNESAPVRDGADLNELIEQAVQFRLEAHLSSLTTISGNEKAANESARAACLVPEPGPVNGRGELDFLIHNEGNSPAYDVFVSFDTGHDFPPPSDRPLWRQIDVASSKDNRRRFTAKLKIGPPSRGDDGNPRPNQERLVWVRVSYRDGLGGPHHAYFLFRLTNSGSDPFMWKAAEIQSEASVPQICKHTRPQALPRELKRFDPEITAVDPKDEVILESATRIRLADPLDSPRIRRSDLLANPELASRSDSSVSKGIDRLLRRKLLRVGQRENGTPSVISLEEAGEERAYRRIYPNYDQLIQNVFDQVCASCPDPKSETSIQELADILELPSRLVEFITRDLAKRDFLRVRPYAGTVKVDRPDPRRCKASNT